MIFLMTHKVDLFQWHVWMMDLDTPTLSRQEFGKKSEKDTVIFKMVILVLQKSHHVLRIENQRYSMVYLTE